MPDLCVACVQALVQPLKFFESTRHVWRCVLTLWLLAVFIAIPQSIAFVQTEERRLLPGTMQSTIVYKCQSAGYTSEWQRKLYFTFITTSVLVIPACVMTFCYANIIRVVWRRAGPVAARNIDEPRIHYVASYRREVASHPAACIAEIVSADRQPRPYLAHCHSLPLVSHVPIGESRRMTLTTKRSVVRMAMSVTIGFMTCFIPYIIVSAVRIYSDYYYSWTSAYAVSSMMALTHSAVNPLLYIIFSKRAVDAAFDRLCRRAKPRCCQPR